MKEIIKIKKSPMIKEELDNEYYPEFVLDFIYKMKDRFDLSIFYKNIKDADFKPVNESEMERPYAGAEYDVMSNVVHYIPRTMKDNIMHELLHMATCIETTDGAISGFMQVRNDGYGIGLGLNEGYTELMDNRYFLDYSENKIKDLNYVYTTSKYICSILEYLLGKEHMEDLYMHADLLTLYKELSEYSSPRRAYNFITRFDRLHIEADTKLHPNILLVNKLYEQTIMFLSECFITKFKMMNNDGELSDEEYEQALGFVKYIMDQNLTFHKIIKSRKLSKYIGPLQAKVNIKMNKK